MGALCRATTAVLINLHSKCLFAFPSAVLGMNPAGNVGNLVAKYVVIHLGAEGTCKLLEFLQGES